MLPIRSLSSTAPRLDPLRIKRVLEGISLWLAVLMLLFVQPLFAEATERAGELRFVDGRGQHLDSATMVSADYQVEVTGMVADVRLQQTFRNAGRHWREAVYVFPLPENASVYGMTMTAGERRIVGEIRERAVAKEEYARARSEGRKVARVEQQRPNLFTTHLANIPPGESVAIELRYQQPVRYQSGEFELRIPTTLTPRYIPGETVAEGAPAWQGGWAMPTAAVPDAHRISPFTVMPGDLQPGSHRASMQIDIKAGLPVSRVSSPSHELATTWNGNVVAVSPAGGGLPMDRDMILRWAPARGMAPSAAVFREQWQGETYLMAMMVPGLGTAVRMPRELVFVIDTSGSMAGESMRQAKQSLLRGLKTLGHDDTFNVIQFNSQTASLFIDPVPATGNYLARARRYVGDLNAEGGTEMAPALDMALNQGRSGASATADGVQRLRQVVFITDGSVGNEAGLFRRISQQLGDRRLFTVAIGSAPNMHFMRKAARFGRGTYTAINSASEVGGPLDELFGKMQSAALTDIQLAWPDAEAGQSAQPQRIGDLFAGEPLIQVVRGQQPKGSVRVSGRLPDGSNWSQSLDLGQAAGGAGLHRLWAQQKIDGLLDSRTLGRDAGDGPADNIELQVTRLGTEHQLITPYTSFLAVDTTPVRPKDAVMARESIPTLLPAGATSGMLRYPQTATIAPLLQALGLLGLMLSAAIGLLSKRVFR